MKTRNAFQGFVFIIGAARSGTKFLRGVLQASSDFAVIPYDVGYIWRVGSENCSHDELVPSMLTAESRSYIRETLSRLALIETASNATLMLEKSVPNSLRVGYLNAVFPEAKFIHIIRDGRAVTESSVRQWNARPDLAYLLRKLRYLPWSNLAYAFRYVRHHVSTRFSGVTPTWGPRYMGIDADVRSLPLEIVCARQWSKCVESARSQLQLVCPGRVFEMRFEDLVANATVIRQLCEFLQLKDAESVMSAYSQSVEVQGLEKWNASLSEAQRHLVLKEIGGLLQDLGYMTSKAGQKVALL